MSLIIAIDGPSASGKSTVSQKAAQRLGCAHVDSGSLYRALTWALLKRKINVTDNAEVAGALSGIKVDLRLENSLVKFVVDGDDPGAELRSGEVNEMVSPVAALPAVREWVVGQLRKAASFGNLVVEGRDIGTVVFPEANFKFYLDATPEERARRRYLELQHAGMPADYEAVLRSILKRDGIDSTRALAPLKIAPGAMVIQSTKMSVDEVVEAIVNKVLPPASLACPSVGQGGAKYAETEKIID